MEACEVEAKFLTTKQALQFGHSCGQDGVFISGIECLLCIEEKNVSDLDEIAKFSSLSPQDFGGATSSARKFLSLFCD